MDEFKEKLLRHVEHVKSVGAHCTSEETTKQALILPLLDILNFNPYNPLKVVAEYAADFPGAKINERVDYALLSDVEPVMFIEAKAYMENLTNHAPQLSRYFNATPGVCIAAITNGREWRFFTDLQNQNVMDKEPFLVVDFLNLKESDIQELARFRYDEFRADDLRNFAESRTYQAIFEEVIEASLRDVDQEFVRYVVTRANPAFRQTQKNLDFVSPLVKKAVASTFSKMVVSGLSAPAPAAPTQAQSAEPQQTAVVDPDNPRILTTNAELNILGIVQDLLRGQVADGEIVAKDTESYYAVLYQGKTNRWVVRYHGNKQRPAIQFHVPLTDLHRAEIKRAMLEIGAGDTIFLETPAHLMRLPGPLMDSLEFCKNDENFKRSDS